MPPSTPDPTLWLTDLMAKQQELLKSLAPPGTPAAADPANPSRPGCRPRMPLRNGSSKRCSR